MNSIAVTCPQQIRTDLRQANNRHRESNPERKEALRIWCIGKLCSCGCQQPANCAHHPTDDLYGDRWADLSECEPYNSGCHHMRHKGYDRCPDCGGWMKRGSEKCAKCRGWRKHNEKAGNIRHPCSCNTGQQRCRRDGRVFVCARSSRNASGCDYFLKRGEAIL